MRLIIDGYNVLKGAYASSHVTPAERNSFVQTLGRYARKKKLTIMIIFDGGPDRWPTKEVQCGITLVYAGAQCTADDYIKQLLKESSVQETVLVSSDKELVRRAKAANVIALSSGEFYAHVLKELQEEQALLPGESELIKLKRTQNPQLDELMQEGAHAVIVKQEEIASVRRSGGYTPSKKERARQKKWNKL